ncbi:MAG: hypothetical protein NVS3B20_20970 [Polyangiales bacterium]
MVDTSERTVEVRRRDGALWSVVATFADDDVMRAEPFESIELPLGRLWVL